MYNHITLLRIPLGWTKITRSAVKSTHYQNHKICSQVVSVPADLLLADRCWKNTLPLVSVICSDTSWRVSVKLHDWGEWSSATSFSSWVLMIYSLPKWKHNVTCWSPQRITEPAHASRLCKCDAFQLWSAVTQQKSDWWDFICDASLRVELHSPPCQ